MILNVNQREFASILAGLRLLADTPSDHTHEVNEIASDGGSFDALNVEQLHQLADRLNAEGGKARVWITVEGAIVQSVWSPRELDGLTVTIIDYDTEGESDRSRITMLHQDGGYFESSYVADHQVEACEEMQALPATDPQFDAQFRQS